MTGFCVKLLDYLIQLAGQAFEEEGKWAMAARANHRHAGLFTLDLVNLLTCHVIRVFAICSSFLTVTMVVNSRCVASGETYIGSEEKHKGRHFDLRLRAVYQSIT